MRHQINHTLFAKSLQKLGIRGVAQTAVAAQLFEHVVYQRFIVGHVVWAAAFRNGIACGGQHAFFFGNGTVNGPLDGLRPVPGHNQHSKFRIAQAHCILKAQVLAHLLQAIHEFRAAHEGNEGSANAAARASRYFVHDSFLVWRHLRFGYGGHAV